MRKWIIGLVVLALIAGGVYVAFGGGGGTLGLAEPTPTAAPLIDTVEAGNRVVADAVVLPINDVNLTFELSNVRVAEIMVEEGEQVAEGEALARLDTRDLDLRVSQAEAALAQAQADLDKLLEGATAEEIAEAEAQIAQAQGQLREVQGSVTSQDIQSAQAGVQEARARLNEARARLTRLQAGPETTQVESARARVDQARATLQDTRNRLSAAKVNAELQIEQAANELRDQQADYSRIYWDNRELENELARGGDELPQERKDQEEAALRAVETAEQALEQAKLNYEEAQRAEITGIEDAEARVREAQSNLDDVLKGFDVDEIESARADVARAEADIASAQAQLSKLQGEERAGRVAAAQAGVNNAQAGLSRLVADPTASEIAQAEAVVLQRQVALDQAQLEREKATLFTPLAGEIAEMNLEIGEIPSATEPAVVIGDFSEWKIETDDLTELSIVNVEQGQDVEITFDAIPDLTLPGTVTQIKPIGKNNQGDITYTVVIEPQEWDSRLRWNMTATVSIESSEEESSRDTPELSEQAESQS